MAHLATGPFKVNLLEGKAKASFLSLIEELDGTKALICDHTLVGPVNLLTTMSSLRDRGVKETLPLKTEIFPNLDVKHMVYVVRPTIKNMDLVAAYVHGINEHKSARKEMRVLFIPKSSQMCRKRLEERGVLGSLELKSVDCFLFPFDNDFLSMEVDHGFREVVVEKDPSMFINAALAIRELESLFGSIPHIIGRGPAARTVVDYLLQLQKQDRTKKPRVASSIDHLILLDRQVDLITPLATQLTYEGLIDEFFSLKCGTCRFPAEKFSWKEEVGVPETPAYKDINLNSGDKLYAKLRDKSFNGIGPAIRRKAQKVSTLLEQSKSRSIDSMRTFISQLPELQAMKRSLATHTTIAELIKEKTDEGMFLEKLAAEQEILRALDTDKPLQFIEDCIARKAPLLLVLRLICLQSLVNGGLRVRVLENYKRDLIQTYGIQLLLPLNYLEKAGLLRPTNGPRHYAALKRTLHLIIEDDSEIEPTDICFTHSIYAPLSVRLIQKFRTWSNIKDILDMVPGPSVEHRTGQTSEENRQIVIVFFLGGCTAAEVSALRFLSKSPDSNVDFVVVTTKLINGNSFLRSVMMADQFPDLKL